MSNKPRITQVRSAGEAHQVLTLEGTRGAPGESCRSPCAACPWRRENTGSFPAEAFAHSARIAVEMSCFVFACHMAQLEHPRICAGFLLRGSDDNLTVRLGRLAGLYRDVHGGGAQLFASYREMALAHGVAEAALNSIRDQHGELPHPPHEAGAAK